MDQVSDRQAVERVLQGDREAYGILVDRYKNLAYRLAYGVLRDCDQAEDAVQETFTLAFQHLERLKDPDLFGAWAAGIVRNVSRAARRKGRRQPVPLDSLVGTPAEPHDLPLPAGEDDEEKLGRLRRLIARLPEKYRQVLELHYFEEHSCERVAAFLSLSRANVVTRLFRARKQILAMLRKEGE